MAPRGKSIEEKRTIILNLFHDSCVPWLLKDIEKAGAKAGVVQNTVKDIVMSLVHDDLASTDKIGTSCYFWSLSSDRTNKARVKHASLTAELASVSTSCADLEAKLEVVRPPPDTEERAAAVAAAAAAQSRHDALSAEVSSHAESDPETLNAMTALAPTALEAANRWTDNIYMVQSYLTRNKGMSAADCQKWVLGEANVNLASLEYVTEESIKASVQPKKPKSKPASGGIKRKAAAAEDGYDD